MWYFYHALGFESILVRSLWFFIDVKRYISFHFTHSSNLHPSMMEVPVTQAATKILARELIRLRQQIAKLQGSRAQVRGVATHTQVCIFCFISSQNLSSNFPNSLER